MKKNTPAKKGFAPFKENKNRAKGDDSRPAKRGAGGRPPRKNNDSEGFRPRKDDGEGFRGRKNDGKGFRPRKNDGEGFRPRKNDGEGFRARKSDGEGFRPRKDDGEGFRGRKDDGEGFRARKNDGEGFRPRKNDGEGFRSRKSDDGEGFRPRKNDGEGFRSRKSDDGEGFRPRKNDGEDFRSRKSDDGEGFRPRKTERRPAGKDENGDPLPAFKKKEHTDGEEARRNRIKPAQKTANGRTPFKPKPGSSRPKFGADREDSAFHGTERGSKRGKDDRETPSGFNRKKYFDNTNERFAAKQDRKTAARKARNSDARDTSSRRSERDENAVSIEGEMPLNKYIAHCGLCSRRKAVDYVKEGKITVNGTVITEPAFKVTKRDEVTILGKKMHIQKNLVYILLNKPKGYITTTDDPEGRKTVMELIQDATEEERVYPVGRLDRNTSGLLLLTNDGELAQKLSHPKHNIRKIYHVGLNKPLTKAHFEQILAGVTLEDGVAQVDVLGYVDNADKTQIGIEIHSGKNRIVRRIFEHLEYEVEKLDRVTYAGLTKKNINRGHWRYLTEKEIILLKHFK